jgi:hypothetical protein
LSACYDITPVIPAISTIVLLLSRAFGKRPFTAVRFSHGEKQS